MDHLMPFISAGLRPEFEMQSMRICCCRYPFPV